MFVIVDTITMLDFGTPATNKWMTKRKRVREYPRNKYYILYITRQQASVTLGSLSRRTLRTPAERSIGNSANTRVWRAGIPAPVPQTAIAALSSASRARIEFLLVLCLEWIKPTASNVGGTSCGESWRSCDVRNAISYSKK